MIKWITRLVGLIVALALVVAGGALWLRSRLATPFQGFTSNEVFVDLPSGTGVQAIADRLTAEGIIPDPWTFRLAARLSGVERRLQAGEYRFSGAATPYEVVDRLARGDVARRALTFPEGLTIQEMAVLFEAHGLGPASAFVGAAADGRLARDWDPDARTLEGYLFPDTYAFSRRVTADAAVAAMLAGFDRAFSQDLRDRAAAAGMSPREVVTLASIVEKETGAGDERPLVAAVYRNRLKIGMPLQCDPTVIYAIMKAGRWRGNLTRADLQLDSPYNTYRYPGLPPGPIASPGRASLEAVVRPADVPYLYFVSRNDGTHAFAATLAEHNRNVAKWQVEYFRQRRRTSR